MYRLLSRITDGLEPLRKKFEEHVARAGSAAVLKITPAPGSVSETGKAETLDPKAYIEALLSVYRKYNAVVHNSFRGEAGFVGSLDRVRRGLFVVFSMLTTRLATSTAIPMLLARHHRNVQSCSPVTSTRCSRRTKRISIPRVWRLLWPRVYVVRLQTEKDY